MASSGRQTSPPSTPSPLPPPASTRGGPNYPARKEHGTSSRMTRTSSVRHRRRRSLRGSAGRSSCVGIYSPKSLTGAPTAGVASLPMGGFSSARSRVTFPVKIERAPVRGALSVNQFEFSLRERVGRGSELFHGVFLPGRRKPDIDILVLRPHPAGEIGHGDSLGPGRF